jgi:transposase InsO family protein
MFRRSIEALPTHEVGHVRSFLSQTASLGSPLTLGVTARDAVAREWAYLRPYYTSADRTRALPGWLEHYNCARPHAALGKQPPMSRFPGGKNLMRAHN